MGGYLRAEEGIELGALEPLVKPQVSVIIPTLNAAAFAEELVAALPRADAATLRNHHPRFGKRGRDALRV